MDKLCYVTIYYDLGREHWKQFGRGFNLYFERFKPFIELFDKCDGNKHEMIVFIDSQYYKTVEQHIKKNIRLIEINSEFMQKNITLWKTLSFEKDIIGSESFKMLMGHRYKYPEHSQLGYSLINHCKIDFINYVIDESLSKAEHYCWVDFGYFGYDYLIPKQLVDLKKLHPDYINYMLINKLVDKDRDIINNLRLAPERIGGFFFYGRKEKLQEYQKLYHEVVANMYKLRIVDDDQHLALLAFFRNPTLFNFHYIGGWHLALLHLQIN